MNRLGLTQLALPVKQQGEASQRVESDGMVSPDAANGAQVPVIEGLAFVRLVPLQVEGQYRRRLERHGVLDTQDTLTGLKILPLQGHALIASADQHPERITQSIEYLKS